MKLRGLAFIVALLLLSATANAAVVYFKDGGQVRGTVVSATANGIDLHTPDGDLHIASDRIARIDYVENAAPVPEAAAPKRLREERSDEPDNQSFGIELGLATPVSKMKLEGPGGGSGENGNTGALLGLQYLYYPSRRLGAGIDFEYAGRSQSDSSSIFPNANTSVSGDSMILMAVLKYSLIRNRSTRPYLLLGAGTNRTSTLVDVTPLNGFAWSDTSTDETRRLVDDNRWGFAGTARLGIDFHFYDPTFFNVELGWTGLYNGTYQPTTAGVDAGITSAKGSLDTVTFAARWAWRF